MVNIQVQEPPTVESLAMSVYVGVPAVFMLYDGVAVLKVAGVAVALRVRGRAVAADVKVTVVGQPHGAALLLEIAAP